MKSHFSTPLQAAPVGRRNGRSTWRLLMPLRFWHAPVRQQITAPAGFITDFASIPRLPLVWWIMSDYGHPAAVIHDWLCESKSHPRKFADEVFHAALIACRVPRWRAALMYAAVRSYATVRGL